MLPYTLASCTVFWNIRASDHVPAPRPALAGDAGVAVGVVVVGQLLARADVARGDDPDLVPIDFDVAVGAAAVVDVAGDVAAKGGVSRPAGVDDEQPDA